MWFSFFILRIREGINSKNKPWIIYEASHQVIRTMLPNFISTVANQPAMHTKYKRIEHHFLPKKRKKCEKRRNEKNRIFVDKNTFSQNYFRFLSSTSSYANGSFSLLFINLFFLCGTSHKNFKLYFKGYDCCCWWWWDGCLGRWE